MPPPRARPYYHHYKFESDSAKTNAKYRQTTLLQHNSIWSVGLGLLLFHQHKKHSRFGVSLPRYTIVTSWRFLMTETSLIIINPPPGDQQRIKSPALVFLLIPIIMPTCRARAHTPGSYPRPPSRLSTLIECNLWAARRLWGARAEDLTCLRTQLFWAASAARGLVSHDTGLRSDCHETPGLIIR